MVETTEEYRTRINQLKTAIENEPYIKEMRENIAEGISKTGNRQADIEEQFQEVIDNTTGKDVISAPELIAARNGEVNLKARLDTEQNKVNAQLAQKASINYVDAILMDIAKGGPNSGPQGPFMSIAALESYDFPDGREGTWLVFDTSFNDGAHSFMWDSTNSVWKDLGVYQATAIGDKTITTVKLAPSAVTREKTDFIIDEQMNLFTGQIEEGVVYDPGTGAQSVNNDYSSGYLTNVEQRMTYSKNLNGHVTFWDGTGNFLGGKSSPALTFTTPANTKKIIFSGKNDTIRNTVLVKHYLDERHAFDENKIKYNDKLELLKKASRVVTSINLFNKDKVILDGFFDNTGIYRIDTGYAGSLGIPVEAGKVYSKNVNGHVTFWDETGNFLSGVHSPAIEVTAPPNASVARIAVSKTELDKAMFVEGNVPVNYVPHNILDIDHNFFSSKNESEKEDWFILGDSTSTRSYNTKAWYDFISEKKQITFTSYSVVGSRISKSLGSTQSFIDRWTGIPDNYSGGLIFGGRNDITQNAPLGNPEDRTESTFYGACHIVFGGLAEKFPGKIGVILPYQRSNETESPDVYKYLDALEEVASYYSMPVCDLYRSGGVTGNIQSMIQKYYTDTVHLNDTGNEVISNKIIQFMPII